MKLKVKFISCKNCKHQYNNENCIKMQWGVGCENYELYEQKEMTKQKIQQANDDFDLMYAR